MLMTDRLEALAAQRRRDLGVPGLAVGIVVDGDLAWFAGLGWADVDRSVPPTPRSLARVASVTKTFTATAILQIRDRGLLRLDDPLERHLPEFAVVREDGGRRSDVTIRAILTHRSGLVTESPPTRWDTPSFPTMAEIIAALPDTAVAVAAESEWKYSNLGFGLLGEVVARLGGRPYVEHVRAEIFEPLGMGDSAFQLDDAGRALAMTGYLPGEHEDRPRPAPVASLLGLTAAGQLHSNVADLARWIAFQTGAHPAGDRVLTRATLAESHEVRYVQPDWTMGQTVAWRIVRRGERLIHNHGGSVHGFNSNVAFHLPTRTGAIVLANLWPSLIASQLAADLLEIVVDGAHPRAAAAGSPSAAPAGLRPLLGRYRAEPGIDADIEWRDGALRLLAPAGSFPLHAPVELVPVAGRERVFRLAHGRGAGEIAAFTQDGDGRPGFELGGFAYRRRW